MEGRLVQKSGNGGTDTTDRITHTANAIGK